MAAEPPRRRIYRLSIPFRRPFASANGVTAERELLLLRLSDADGFEGWGEAAPFAPYDGITIAETAAALLAPAPSPEAPAPARAAEEMARLDLAGRRAGRALGEPGAEAIAVNRTVAGGPPEEAAADAAEGVRAGYACFKVKVGLEDDVERVAAVRDAVGPWPALRIDANGAWDPDLAVRRLDALAPFDLELVEQPCPTWGELAEVRARVGVPVVADELVTTAEDVDLAARAGACDAITVKLASSGGFGAARAVLRRARAHGLGAYLSSTFDGPWGIAAALQLAASEAVSLACGLATLELFDARLAEALPAPRAGLLAVPPGPGLGVTLDEGALSEVLVEEIG